MDIGSLRTPALIIDVEAMEHNIATMAAALPGARLRPHVKAHKTTALARLQAEAGHRAFTCATVREMVGMARAGLGDDLLLANEVIDVGLLRELVEAPGRMTVAVDSEATVAAAAAAGVQEVLVDVNIGLPRCGCLPSDAGAVADAARAAGLVVRGVMGYEGHIVGNPDRAKRESMLASSMEQLQTAADAVGAEEGVISSGGTGTYDINTVATEIQAGSYVLMDTAYDKLDLPFRPALTLLTTVLSVAKDWAVCDGGLKSLGMDHGDPTIPGAQVFFCSDEHITFMPGPEAPVKVGDRIPVVPAHVDPTIALHERMHLVRGDEVVETWDVDLRGW